jgi:hypothetical protein
MIIDAPVKKRSLILTLRQVSIKREMQSEENIFIGQPWPTGRSIKALRQCPLLTTSAASAAGASLANFWRHVIMN